jgi:hypothetical protein
MSVTDGQFGRFTARVSAAPRERSSTVVLPVGGIAAGTKRSTPVTNGSAL